MEIKFSIIIPTYKRPEKLEKSIKSVLNQSYKNFEIIIVDDNEPESIFRKNTEIYMGKYNLNSKIKYLKQPKNLGACSARNLGGSEATGDVLAFLDDDDEFLPNKLEEISTYYVQTNKNLLVASDYIIRSEENKKEYLFKHKYLTYEEIKARIYSENLLGSNSFVTINKNLFDEIKGFDVNLKCCQDWDMWIRLIENGANIIMIEKPLVIYNKHIEERVSTSMISLSEGYLMFYRKHKHKIDNQSKKLKSFFYKLMADKMYLAKQKKQSLEYYWKSITYNFNVTIFIKMILIAVNIDYKKFKKMKSWKKNEKS